MKHFLYVLLIAVIVMFGYSAQAAITVYDDATYEGVAESVDFNNCGVTFDGERAEVTPNNPLATDIATDAGKYKYAVMPICYATATESRTGGIGTPLLGVGLAAGVDEIGTAEGCVNLGEAADYLRFSFPMPSLFYDGDVAGDFGLSLNLSEIGGAVQTDLEVRMFSNGSATPIWAGFIPITNLAARGWSDLTCTGANTVIGKNDIIVVEVTVVADTDDCNVYAARLKYRPGIDID
jgi:hypothetical protein